MEWERRRGLSPFPELEGRLRYGSLQEWKRKRGLRPEVGLGRSISGRGDMGLPIL